MDKKTKWILIIGTLGVVAFLLLKKKAPVPTALPIAPPTAPPAPVTTAGRLIALASEQLGLPESALTVRSLLPSDIGLTTWSMNLATANAWNTVVNTAIGSDRYIAITGVYYSGTAAEQIRITAGGSVVADFNIEQVPGITTTHHIKIPSVIVQQNQNITIQVYASAISATDNVMLEGTVVERAGMVLA